jgi:hypothetical protein
MAGWTGFVAQVAKVLEKARTTDRADQNGDGKDGVMAGPDLDRRERPARVERDCISDARGAATQEPHDSAPDLVRQSSLTVRARRARDRPRNQTEIVQGAS